MGKIRIKTLGDETQEEQDKKWGQRRRENKKPVTTETQNEIKTQKRDDEQILSASETSEPSVVAREISDNQNEEPATVEIRSQTKTTKAKKSKFAKKAFHSQTYEELLSQVDRSKSYTVSEALELLKNLQRGKFDETVELHINTSIPSVSGNVTLPYGSGKKTRVAVADDGLIAEIEKGIINFDILVATPSQMPKLAHVAKILGPRGLMPNPKNGTITDKPQDLVKKYEGGQINFKTEAKIPVMHLIVGKMSFGKEKLSENIESLISAVKKANIANVTLKSTMSPGIKIRV